MAMRTDNTKAHIRKAFSQGLVKAGEMFPEVVLLSNDMLSAIYGTQFKELFPDRYIEAGIAEQNMLGMAAGLASCGKTPIVSSYANFATWRVAEQVRNLVSYTNFDIKIASLSTGLSFGEGGMSHQSFEDVALIRILPNFRILVPADAASMQKSVILAVSNKGPVYIRGGRADEYIVYPNDDFEFEFGSSSLLAEGTDIALIACGYMVHEALSAAEMLEKQGVSTTVVDMYSIKPIDKERLLQIRNTCRAIMTIEEHFIIGGLGSAVMETFDGLSHPPILRKGLADKFPPVGPCNELREHLGLCAESIYEDALEFLDTV